MEVQLIDFLSTEFFKQGMPGGGHLPAGTIGSMNSTFNPFSMAPRLDIGGDPRGGANGGMARVMGGEYIMSPRNCSHIWSGTSCSELNTGATSLLMRVGVPLGERPWGIRVVLDMARHFN